MCCASITIPAWIKLSLDTQRAVALLSHPSEAFPSLFHVLFPVLPCRWPSRVLDPGILPCSPSSRLCCRSCRRRGRTGRSSPQSWQGHRRRIPVPPDSPAEPCHLPGATLQPSLGTFPSGTGSWCPPGLSMAHMFPSVQLHIDKVTVFFFRAHNCFLKSSWKIPSVKVEN